MNKILKQIKPQIKDYIHDQAEYVEYSNDPDECWENMIYSAINTIKEEGWYNQFEIDFEPTDEECAGAESWKIDNAIIEIIKKEL